MAKELYSEMASCYFGEMACLLSRNDVPSTGFERMENKIVWLQILFFAFLSLCAPAVADGIIIVDPPAGFDIGLDQALSIKYHHVNITIHDQMATTRIDQVFVNENPWDAEGTYIFPLPQGAFVSDFAMWIDGRPVKGEILKAEEARMIYDETVRKMRDPALLEYVGRDAIKASIYPIPSGGERRITLEYSQILTADGGQVHYVYPLSTERYSAQPLEELAIRAEINSSEPLKTVYTPMDKVFVQRIDDHKAILGLEQRDVLPDKDFHIYYSMSDEDIGLTLLSYKEAEEDGFFLLMASPNVRAPHGAVIAKDVLLVLDTSGSMEGEKLDQAKEASRFVLRSLNSEDRFNLISFSTGIVTFDDGLQPASRADDALSFVNGLEALGGTNINSALLTAMSMAQQARPTIVIFLTDGLATEGVTDTVAILDNIEDNSAENLRIFTFGVGDDVDTDLLDQLALDQGGASAYVRTGQRIDDEITSFYKKVSNPVLSHLELDFGDIHTDRLYPSSLPDLFAGSQLVLTGRYREGEDTDIALYGDVGDQKVSYIYGDVSFSSKGGQDFIPRLWATRAIGDYLTKIRLEGEREEWIQSVVSLSLRYGIITPYTSFLIEEEDVFSAQGREAVARKAKDEMADMVLESTGQNAVDRASLQGLMTSAPAPESLPFELDLRSPGGSGEVRRVLSAEVVRQVGSKTFLNREGKWIDTAYDSSSSSPEKVEFLSPRYFELLSQHPDLGIYFAIGQSVLVVYEGKAYEVIGGTGT